MGFSSSAPTCERAHSIDLAYLRQRGLLRPGNHSSLTWSRGGERTGSVSIIAQPDGVRLVYSVTGRDDERISVDELVAFAYTTTRFGGRRQCLTCLKCGRRCRKIYGGRYFRCRQCHGLVYASTREPLFQRALDRADRLIKRLGGGDWWTAFDSDELPPKPPRMRWKTYRQLEREFAHLQMCWRAGAMQRFGVRF